MPVKTTLFYVFLLVLLSACSDSRTLISKGKTQFGKIKFYYVSDKLDSSRNFYYADVDSFGVKYFFSFGRNDILKIKENDKNIMLTIFPHSRFAYRQLNVTNSEIENPLLFQRLSKVDSITFLKAEKSIKLSNVTTVYWQLSQGFIKEILYYHGRPKKAKFKPLNPN